MPINKNNYGLCGIDNLPCFSKGAICRRNTKDGFQTNYDYANPSIRIPFRNKSCTHFKKNIEEKSEWEKVGNKY